MNSRVLQSVTIIAVFLGPVSVASAKVARNWNDLVPGPRVIRYDQEKDSFIHQNSVISSALNRKPGGEHAYSGNRLQTFQYHGKPGTGGLYDALNDYKNKLDARNYRYRHR